MQYWNTILEIDIRKGIFITQELSFEFQVELLGLLGDINFKIVCYLETAVTKFSDEMGQCIGVSLSGSWFIIEKWKGPVDIQYLSHNFAFI